MTTKRHPILLACVVFAASLVASCATTVDPPGSAPASTGYTPYNVWQSFKASDGVEVHYRYWPPAARPRAVVQIVHGAAEHSGRYDRFAKALVTHGYAVYATDHRGHGLTRVRSGELGDAGPDAWNRFVEDEQQLTETIRKAHPGAKVVLFGHSLGSFIAQDYLTRRPELLDAVVMSGTAYGPPPPKELLAALNERATKAPFEPSAFWASLFADFNKPFSSKTGFEWLSRDEAEVQKYVNDREAGFAFNNELVRDIFQGFAGMRDPARESRIPKNIPVLIIQGAEDPVGGNLKGTQALLERYRALGLTRVSHRFYQGARHEVLNETNREEVTRNVLDWLQAVLS